MFEIINNFISESQFLFEICQFFSYVGHVLGGMTRHHIFFGAANFFVSACVFYTCIYLFNLVRRRKWYVRLLMLLALLCGVYGIAYCFDRFSSIGYTQYSLKLMYVYFVIFVISNSIFEKYKRSLSKRIMRILKFDFYSLFNWVFLSFSSSYFLPESELIQAGHLKLFVLGVFFIFIISIILLRRIAKDSIANRSNALARRVLKTFYSGSWVLIVLFLFMWLSDESILVKSKKVIFSMTIFISFYFFKWLLKRALVLYIQKKPHQKELASLYNFISFLLKVIVDPIIAIFISYIWQIDCIALLVDVCGLNLLTRALTFLVFLVLFRVIMIFADLIVRAYLAERATNAAIAKRLETLIHIIVIVFKVVLATIFLFIALLILRVNPTPLFGNIWILLAGLLLGLQTLMKDLAIGVLMMFEDTFHIGDEVEVSGVSGQVEDITLRVLKVRDSAGALISIPFNKIEIFSNKSRGYINLIFTLVVDVNADVQVVKKLLGEAVKELRHLPDYEKKILGDGRIAGPITITATGLVFEVSVPSIPMGIKSVRGVYYGICHNLFSKHKIKLAYDLQEFKKLLTQ